MTPPSHFQRVVLIAAACFAFSLTGCQSLSESAKTLDDSMPWNSQQAAQRRHEESAARIVAIWSHDVLSTPQQGAIQGFGGRMYFYNRRQEAVEVDGQLIVYAFDDTGMAVTDHTKRAPNRKYVFRAEQLQSHRSESELGPSYSFWIPWQKLGGEERKISLVPVFIPNEGEIINGLFSKVVLPGNNPNRNEQGVQDRLVQRGDHKTMRVDTFGNHESNSNGARSTQRNTQTIQVSPNLTRHMTNAPQQQMVAPSNFSGTTPVPAANPTVLPNYDQYNARRRPTGIQTNVNPSGIKTIKLGPPKRP